MLARTKEHIEYAATVGASAVSVCPYYYRGIRKDNLSRFMRELTRDSALPIFLDNSPELHNGKGNLHLDSISEIAKLQQVAGFIDKSGSITYFGILLLFRGEGFKVFQGSEKRIYDSACLGDIDGAMSSMVNIAPRFVSEVYQTIIKARESFTGEENDRRRHGAMNGGSLAEVRVRDFLFHYMKHCIPVLKRVPDYDWEARKMQRRMNKGGRIAYDGNGEHIVSGLKHLLSLSSSLYSRRVIGSLEMADGTIPPKIDSFKFDLTIGRNVR